jgi:hypothetical protein
MNPVIEKDVANLRSSLPHFLAVISLVMAVLILFGKLGPGVGDFEFLAGAALLLWAFINLQHLRNIYLYIHMKIRPDSIEGQIKRTYWLNQRLVAYEAFTFAVIYGLVWTANGTHFFLGGAFACFGLAMAFLPGWSNNITKLDELEQERSTLIKVQGINRWEITCLFEDQPKENDGTKWITNLKRTSF